MATIDRFRTRNNLIEPQQSRTKSNKNKAQSTKPIDILPLITVWLQVRVLPAHHRWNVHHKFRCTPSRRGGR
jgi:hypothetical protein